MLHYRILLLFLLFSSASCLWLSAQPLLTKTEAVSITLKNNYDIQIDQNNVAIAENNTSPQLNGYRPTLDFSAGVNSSLGGSSQRFSSGNENEVSNAFNWGANASLSANYTIFDKTRAATVAQLREIANLTDLNLRQTIENSLLQVFTNYYEVARLHQNIRALEQTLTVSNRRLLRIQYQYEYGQSLRLDLLNAEVDLQRDSISLIDFQNQLANAKRNLNVAMGRGVQTPFSVDTIVTYDNTLSLPQILADAERQNIQMYLINKNLEISAQDIDIIEAGGLPTLRANLGYNYNFSDNASGSFIDLSSSRALAGGLTVAWNIFDGGRRKIQTQNARINIESQTIQKEQILEQLQRDITNAWNNYQNALYILEAEAKNLELNELNLQRTEEQLKIGQLSSVEFRQAQLNLLTAATNYNTAKYNAKILEIQLLQLSGGLLEAEF